MFWMLPWISSAVLLSATPPLVYKHYWHFGSVSFFFFFFLSRTSHAFVQVWHLSAAQQAQVLPVYFHRWVIQSLSVRTCLFLKISLLLQKLYCSSLGVGDLISWLSFLFLSFLSLFLKGMELFKGMLDKWKLVITINKPSVYANSKMTAYLLV